MPARAAWRVESHRRRRASKGAWQRAAARREIVKTTAAAAKTLIEADKSLSTAEAAALREAASAPEVPAR
jgi:hypothetical protein